MYSIAEYIVILSDDISYSTLLMKYINEHRLFQSPIQILSKVEYCLDFVERERTRFILTEEKFYDEVKGGIKQTEIMLIPLYTGKTDSKGEGIYKYQSARDIGEGIKSILQCKKETNRFDTHRLITILNPCGNMNTTLLGVVYAISQSRDKNVLCIDLEPYSCLDEALFQDRHRGLSDYIYFARQGTQQILKNYDVIRGIDKVYFLPHMDHYSDLNVLMNEDIGNICLEAEKEFHCFVDILLVQQISPAIEPYVLSSDVIYMEKFEKESTIDCNYKMLSMLQQKGLEKDQKICFLPSMRILTAECTNYKDILFHNDELVNQFIRMLDNEGGELEWQLRER